MTVSEPNPTPCKAFERVAALIYQVSGVPVSRIGLSDSLIITLGLDSVELIDLLMQLEAYGVMLSAEQVTAALTVGDLVLMMRRCRVDVAD